MGMGGESEAVRCGMRGTRVRFAKNGNGGEVFDELSERVLRVRQGDGTLHTVACDDGAR